MTLSNAVNQNPSLTYLDTNHIPQNLHVSYLLLSCLLLPSRVVITLGNERRGIWLAQASEPALIGG